MAITNARILIRRGLEADFNPDGLQPGEWALSVDRGKEILRVCVSPGEFIRIATYESFEKDMAQIEAILEECETIEEAVTAIQSEINAKEVVFESYVQQAKGYSETAAAEASKATTEADRAKSEADRAKTEADRAESIANIGIATTEKAGIVKPDGTTITVDADGTIHSVGGGTAGTTDYEDLSNKPSVNGVELSGNKTTADLGITAESVGADAAGSASTALSDAKDYTDAKIADLVGGAPSTLDTLKEISDALAESGEAVEAINQAIGNKLDKNGDSKDNTVTFTQASTRENIASTEKHFTLFGKIAKWFSDLKTVAFSGSYNDLNDKPAIPTKTSELENDSGFMGSATALDTYEEIMANTESGKFAGAKGVKEGFSAINDSLAWWIANGFLPDPNNPYIPFTLQTYDGRVTIQNSNCYIYENDGKKIAHVDLTLYWNKSTTNVQISVCNFPKVIENTSEYDVHYDPNENVYALFMEMTSGQTRYINFEYETDGTF